MSERNESQEATGEEDVDLFIIEAVHVLTIIRATFSEQKWPELGEISQRLVLESQKFKFDGVATENLRKPVDEARDSTRTLTASVEEDTKQEKIVWEAYVKYMRGVIASDLSSDEAKEQAIGQLDQNLAEHMNYVSQKTAAEIKIFADKLQGAMAPIKFSFHALQKSYDSLDKTTKKSIKQLKGVALMVALATIADWVHRANPGGVFY